LRRELPTVHPEVPNIGPERTVTEPLSLVVLAAGIGSRYGGLKQLEPVGPAGATLTDYAVYDAIRAGITRAVFVIRPEIEDALLSFAADRFAGRIEVATAHQRLEDVPAGATAPAGRIKPWGTGHAVLAAEPYVAGPFVVVNADDFYGLGAYRASVRFLRSDPDGWAVMGYRVADTLSEAGGVSRAVVRTDAVARLTGIEEVRDIARHGDEIVGRAHGHVVQLRADDLVSTNMWSLTPPVFGLLRRELAAFLGAADLAAAEFLLPAVIDAALRRGEVRVLVLEASSSWLGMTYPADRPAVERALLGLVERGEYPERLWT
jgi:NDP-sugar pyrophosphorylase family protein